MRFGFPVIEHDPNDSSLLSCLRLAFASTVKLVIHRLCQLYKTMRAEKRAYIVASRLDGIDRLVKVYCCKYCLGIIHLGESMRTELTAMNQ